MTREKALTVVLFALGLAATGCRSAGVTTEEHKELGPWWDVDQAEVLVWKADNPAYQQGRALEGSGLVAHDGMLFAVAEKYAQLLIIDPVDLSVETTPMDLPPFAELEGVTVVDGGEILLCDEANAAVWATELPGKDPGSSLRIRKLELVGPELSGGKLGVEGITVSQGSPLEVFLMLERSGTEEIGCQATIFRLERQGDRLNFADLPLVIDLEDCNWRLTGLQYWSGRLLALKTRYPGERYEVVVVDTDSGALTTVLEMTDLLMEVRQQGWGNNVEGITVTGDGSLWLISDNAMTDRAESSDPPLGDDKTLLMRIPPLDLPNVTEVEH